MPKRAVFERSRRELSLDVSIGVHIFLVVKQSSLEGQSRGCAKTPILTVSTRFSRSMENEHVDAGRDGLISLARPSSQTRTGTGKYSFFLFS